MSDKRSGLGVPLAVFGGCVAIFAVVLGLLSRSGSGDDSAAVGFPVVLVVLTVLAVVLALVWRVVSRRRSGG